MRRQVKVPALLAGVVALAALVLWYSRSPKAAISEPVQGMVRATEIKIAPEVSGHLAQVLVSRGQHVNRGDVVALLNNRSSLPPSVRRGRRWT
jgi:HlyD family secretion protein